LNKQFRDELKPFLLDRLFVLQIYYHYYWYFTKRSRYSDSLLAEPSGDRNSVQARFSAPVQTGPGAHPVSCTVGTGSHTGGLAVGAWVAHVTLHFLPLLILLVWGMYPTSGSTTFISFNLTHVRQGRSCPCTKLSTPPWRRMIQLPTHYEDTTNGTHPVPEAQFAEPAVAYSMSGIVIPFVQTVAQLLNSATLFHQYSKMIPIFCFRALANLRRSCISAPNMKLCRPQKRTQWGRTVDPPAGFDVQERNEEFITGLLRHYCILRDQTPSRVTVSTWRMTQTRGWGSWFTSKHFKETKNVMLHLCSRTKTLNKAKGNSSKLNWMVRRLQLANSLD